MIGKHIEKLTDTLFEKAIPPLARFGFTPNMLTLIGFFLNIGAAFLFARGKFFLAGLIVLFANAFDVLDGQLARRSGMVSAFGGFLDSVVDRYSDMMLLLGLIFYYARLGERLILFILGFALIGSIMTSYTRARAECIIPSCKVGFFERPERIVLIILGALLGKMEHALLLLAVFSNITVVHRVLYTHKVLTHIESEKEANGKEAGESTHTGEHSVH